MIKMTNQDEKLNVEIWLAESKESDWHICNGHPWITATIIDKMLDKARQQGIEAERKRIIEILDKAQIIKLTLVQLGKHERHIPAKVILWKDYHNLIEKLKNSEANGK